MAFAYGPDIVTLRTIQVQKVEENEKQW